MPDVVPAAEPEPEPVTGSVADAPVRAARPAVAVLGVRHHGPGSARSVREALDELDPEVVLVEGPPELDAVLAFAADPAMVPPVAGLVYAIDEPWRATFYPMAQFSPEWVALRWAAEHGRRARFVDLPAENMLAGRQASAETSAPEPEQAEPAAEDAPQTAAPEAATPVAERPDAIAVLAAAAGYDDPERWWEDAVEHRAGSALERFEAIRAAMAQVREAHPWDDEENARREAAMRTAVRAEAKAAQGPVVLVCGAYHAPAVHPDAFGPVTADRRLLAGLPKIKVTATWAPWTAQRLAISSGYGAGITSPGWYQHLFVEGGRPGADGTDVVSGWLVRVAQALRADGLDASPAQVVEATRLAEALAAVRGRPSVGLDELTDATLAALCDGSVLPLELVERTLVVGETLGSVPDAVPMVPLATDLARRQRALRLKPAATVTTLQLDLRKELDRERSLLFHRLLLIEVPWALPAEAQGRTTGTFKEVWQLEWRPELAIAVVDAGLRGTTVPDAAAGRVREAVERAADLAELSRLVEQCLLCDLPGALRDVLTALEQRTALQHDALSLLGTVEPLARTRRYGTVRDLDTSGVGEVLRTVITRVAVGLRAACAALDEEAGARMRLAVESADRGVRLLDDEALAAPWRAGLRDLAADERAHAGVSGRVQRLLLDAGELDRSLVAERMSRRLSVAAPAGDGAAWLDGFLEGDALLLLHDAALLAIVDAWVAEVDEPTFDDLLPLLRRAFSRFTAPERRQVGERLRWTAGTGGADAGVIDLDRGLPAARAVARLLGLEVTA